jgi:hypothetical protein
MEHREPPRIVTGGRRVEGALEDTGGQPPFRRLSFVRNQRQIHFSRSLLFSVAALAVLIVLFYLGSQATRAAIGWLHHQSQYQLPFEQIQVVPEPPPWFRGGARAFLEAVRLNARESESIAMLDVTPDQIILDFKNYAWVRDVGQVTYGPRTIIVPIRYRQPVAYVPLLKGDRKLVDETGTILRTRDIDETLLDQVVRLAYLIRIEGTGLAAPSDPRPGIVWKTRAVGSDHDEVDVRVLAAAKLAGFLSQPSLIRDAESMPALRFVQINVTDLPPPGAFGLYVLNAEYTAIWWNEAPGDEPPGRPSAAEKWAMLRRWRESTDYRPLPQGDYWAFKGTQVSQVCPHKGHPH